MPGYNDLRTNPLYFEKNPEKKDVRWASDIITVLRRLWRPLVDPKRALDGMKILMGQQNMEEVVRSFKEGSAFLQDVKKEDIVAVPVFEKLRNILIAEFRKGSYLPQVDAMDPAAEAERRQDLTMLKNRHLLENPMNALGARAGQPPYQLDRKHFSSNVDKFDELGLNPTSPQDLSFFRDVFQRLDHEIATTSVIQALYKYNEFDNWVEEIVNDLLAKKAISFQVTESPQTGELKWTYLAPEQVYWIMGHRRDGKDAPTLGYQRGVSVQQFLELSAGYFDFTRDKMVLLQAIRHTNAVDWANLTYEGAFDGEGTLVCSWSQLQAYQVQIGYIEFKSVDQVAKKVNKVNGIYYPMRDPSQNLSANSIYEKQVSELQNTYKAFFVATGVSSQYLWNYGTLYHQLVEGESDEFSNYSLSVLVGTGQTAVEVSRTLLRIANFAFYKLMWGVYESKPNVEVYNVDSLISLLDAVGPTTGSAAGLEAGRMGVAAPPISGGKVNELENVISFMRRSLIRLYSSGDQKMGGDGKPHYVEPGGLDPIATAMQAVIDWAEAKISANLGINAMREGFTPDPKDGYKLNMEATAQSRNATFYLSEAIAYLIRTTCTHSLLLAQDTIGLQGKGLRFLQRLVGSTNVETIQSLNKVALHRYGLFVNVFNSEARRQEVRQEGLMAYQKGDIQYHEYMLIKEIPDYKKAAMTLAFFRERGLRIEKEMAQQKFQMDMQVQNNKIQGEIAVENAKGSWKLKEMDKWGEYYMRAHQIPADAALQKKQMEIESEKGKQDAKADSKIKEIQAKGNVDLQQPLPNVVPG